MLGANWNAASTRNNAPGRMWMSVRIVFRVNPPSSAAAGEEEPPPRLPGKNRTMVRRVTAATPITTSRQTAIQRKRVADLDTDIVELQRTNPFKYTLCIVKY